MIFYGRTFIQWGCLERGDLKGVPQRDFRPANLLFKVFWPVFPFGHGPFWVWSLLGIVPFGHGPFWVRSLLGMVPFGAWSLLAGPFWPVPFGQSLMAWSLMTSNALKSQIGLQHSR